jgi:hypothetical protein
MTFLKTRYTLQKDLAPHDLHGLTRLATVYGIRGLWFEGHDLIVEYDASRMNEAEVLAQVRASGAPVEPLEPIPQGSSDYAGVFCDFAWPTEGLSPANQKAK